MPAPLSCLGALPPTPPARSPSHHHRIWCVCVCVYGKGDTSHQTNRRSINPHIQQQQQRPRATAALWGVANQLEEEGLTVAGVLEAYEAEK